MTIAATRPAILFVCLGNICRSPLAEGAFRQLAEARGHDVMVDSAGTGNWHAGNPPDRRAIAVARRHGVDISGYRARQIVREDFRRFSHIVALDTDNLAEIRRLAPVDSSAGIMLLLDLVEGRAGDNVVDPYYGGDSGFETTWSDVQAAAQALIERL